MSDGQDSTQIPVVVEQPKSDSDAQKAGEEVPIQQPKSTKYCANCGTQIDKNAAMCTNCGVRQTGSAGEKNPVIAGILSFLIVGLGQVYAGKPKRGIILFIVSVVLALLSWLIIPGILVFACWLIAIYDAYVLAQGKPGPFSFIDRYTNEP